MQRSIIIAGLAVAIAACGSKSPSGPNPPANKILIVGSVMGPQYEHFNISQQGADFGSAVVTLNGVSLPATSNGRYDYTFPSAIPVGGALDLVVKLGGATASAHETIINRPTLTTPTNNQSFGPSDDIPVTWTATDNPDFWQVWLQWHLNGSGDGIHDSLPASARAATLHAAAIPAGATDITVEVFGYGHGSFTGDADQASNMYVRYSAAPANITIGAAGPAPILITGFDMSTQFENFSISRSGSDLSQAVVSINGTTIPTSANGSYHYNIGHELAPGTDLVLRVELDGDVVTATATIPAPPVITAPTSGQVVTVGQPIDFTWTDATDPDWWRIGLYHPESGVNVGDSLQASARAGSLATTAIPAGAGKEIQARLYAYLKGSFTGPIDPNSNMHVRIATSVSTITGP